MKFEIWKFVYSVLRKFVVGSAVCNVSTERNAVIFRDWWFHSSAFYDKYITFLRNVMKKYPVSRRHKQNTRLSQETAVETCNLESAFSMQCYIRHVVLSILILPSLLRTRAARDSSLLLFQSQLSAVFFPSTLQTPPDVVRSLSWPYKVWWHHNTKFRDITTKVWWHHNAKFGDITTQSLVTSQHKVWWHHNPKLGDITTQSLVTSQRKVWWHHNTKFGDVTTQSLVTS